MHTICSTMLYYYPKLMLWFYYSNVFKIYSKGSRTMAHQIAKKTEDCWFSVNVYYLIIVKI